MRPAIDLLVPGLFHLAQDEPEDNAWARCFPALYRILRYGRTRRVNPQSLDEMLLQRIAPSRTGLPYAANPENPAQASELLFVPVSLRADINNALIIPGHNLDGQLGNLINDLSDYFKVDFDVTVEAEPVYRMRLHQSQPVQGMPHYLSAVGTPVTPYLQAAREQVEWYRLLNEIQMFLHQHPLNQQAMERGQLPINSLWCWGGDAPGVDAPGDFEIYSNEPEIRALGEVMGQGGYPLEALSSGHSGRQLIVVDLAVLQLLKGYNQRSPENILQDLESRITELLEVSNTALRLCCGGVTDVEYRPADEWRFWRKGRDLASFSEADSYLPDQPL